MLTQPLNPAALKDYALNQIPSYVLSTAGIYASWTLVHYASAHAYANYCTEWSLWGFITSPIQTVNPVCKGLNWVVYTGSNTMSSIFVVMGTWATSRAIQYTLK